MAAPIEDQTTLTEERTRHTESRAHSACSVLTPHRGPRTDPRRRGLFSQTDLSSQHRLCERRIAHVPIGIRTSRGPLDDVAKTLFNQAGGFFHSQQALSQRWILSASCRHVVACTRARNRVPFDVLSSLFVSFLFIPAEGRVCHIT